MRMNFEVMRMIITEQRTAVKMMKSRNTCGSIEMSRRDAADCLTRFLNTILENERMP